MREIWEWLMLRFWENWQLTAYLHAVEYEFEKKQVFQRRNMPPAVDVVLKSVCLGFFSVWNIPLSPEHHLILESDKLQYWEYLQVTAVSLILSKDLQYLNTFRFWTSDRE